MPINSGIDPIVLILCFLSCVLEIVTKVELTVVSELKNVMSIIGSLSMKPSINANSRFHDVALHSFKYAQLFLCLTAHWVHIYVASMYNVYLIKCFLKNIPILYLLCTTWPDFVMCYHNETCLCGNTECSHLHKTVWNFHCGISILPYLVNIYNLSWTRIVSSLVKHKCRALARTRHAHILMGNFR